MKTLYRYGRAVFLLLRCNLSLAIAFSGLAGYLLRSHSLSAGAIFTFTGIFFLSCAASALNQYQERHWDLLMKRTSDRPLPSKVIRPGLAAGTALIFGITGTVVLFSGTTITAALLGVLNLVLYNGMYTPLKRKSRFAVFIGALTGAIPPLIGWAAAGGTLSNPFILAIALFMYIWQVPHFLLLQLRFGKEYAAAGFPRLYAAATGKKGKAIVFAWMAGTSVCSLLLPLFQESANHLLTAMVLVINCAAIFLFYRILVLKKGAVDFNAAFRSIYLYQVGIFIVLLGNGVFIAT